MANTGGIEGLVLKELNGYFSETSPGKLAQLTDKQVGDLLKNTNFVYLLKFPRDKVLQLLCDDKVFDVIARVRPNFEGKIVTRDEDGQDVEDGTGDMDLDGLTKKAIKQILQAIQQCGGAISLKMIESSAADAQAETE
jgi:hypothetical protein